jgi:very-short-patch-repair endonuclease
VVDELPDVIAAYLFSGEQRMRILPLPPLEHDPRDELSREFQDAISRARLTDAEYVAGLEELNGKDDEEAAETARRLERALRDRLRAELGMGLRQTKADPTLAQHAKNNGIAPSYDLPAPADEHEDGRHTDGDIQTLLLPDDLERKLNSLLSKRRTWSQETGINVLHAAFGFLEWTEPNASEASFAPLVLLPIEMEKVKTRDGNEFWVKAAGEDPETNLVLAEKLRLDFGIDLPKFASGSIEQYLQDVATASPTSLKWKIRRQVTFGIFPSARMAMYLDLDTATARFERSEILTSLFAGSLSSGGTPFADDYQVDEPAIEKKVPCLVLDADSSQFSTLVDVSDGKNLAVEGPPGTGKSQTIVNVIASAIAQGRKVLFVAEKTAALEVVKSRLEAVGLGEFLLPLQAERSTREAVISSIRNRVTMNAGPPVRDFDARIARYRRIRSELATYIDVVSSPFGQTGYKIYDILGKSIATNELMDSLPRPLQTPQRLENVERLSPATLEAIKSAARDIEKTWSNIKDSPSHWRDVDLTSVDRFSVDRLIDIARNASVAFAEASASAEHLSTLGLDEVEAEHERVTLAQCLDQLAALTPDIDIGFLANIFQSDRAQDLIDFFRSCEQCKAASSSLGAILADTHQTTVPERLRELHGLCKSLGLSSLGSSHLAASMETAAKKLAIDKAVYNELEPFIRLCPAAASISIGSLRHARSIVTAYERALLALRTEQLADVSVAKLVRELAQMGIALRNKKERLSSLVSVDLECPITDLRAHAGMLREATWLSVLSPSYRAAKRLYIAHSKTSRFDTRQAAEHLYELADFRAAAEAFTTLQQARAIFGLHFRGIETDFDQFLGLIAFFEVVEDTFAGAQHREVRNFLKTGDLELLQSIPPLAEAPSHSSFADLAANIAREEDALALHDQSIRKILGHTDLLLNPDHTPVDELPTVAAELERLQALRAALNESDAARLLLGANFKGAATDPDLCRSEFQALDLLRGQARNARTILGLLEDGRVAVGSKALRGAIDTSSNAKSRLEDLSRQSGIDFGARFAGESLSETARLLTVVAEDGDSIFLHAAHVRACHAIDEYSLGWILQTLREHERPFDHLAEVFEAIIFRAMAIRVYELQGSALSRHSGTALNDRRKALADLDREIIKLSRQDLRLKAHRASKPPAGIGYGKKSTWTDMALVSNEISKKKRYIPVRDLTRRAGAALLDLKPCWMMSPLAVAQYLPRGSLSFDLCIIDEASQMPPEDAVGALARCGQVMVVGDTNQLPPTNFFRKLLDDEDTDEDEAVLDESILEIANGAFRPGRRLRWHYRSRHSGLIRFSNKYVYDDDLIVFPSATEDSPTMGVSFVPVQGRYRAGANSDEASAMIEAILRFMRTDPDRSLGVVTLNQKQRDLLLEEMETAVSRDRIAAKYVEDWKNRNDGLESFFIKNLENVQGDERDVIFIGTVYGPEQIGGPVMQRFGPINGVAGKRRLNVLFSRAKQQIVTFSSMTAADIRADEHGNPGAFLLKRWLEYSATGVIEGGQHTGKEPDSDFEVFVINQVRATGCVAVPQVGVAGYFIDIGVKHPEWPHGYIMGIECDGAAYHSSRSARDRDRLREEVLGRLGWKLHRIWSTDWFNDPRAQAQHLRTAISARLQELRERQRAVPVPPVEDEDAATAAPSEINEPAATEPPEDSSDTFIEVGDTVRIRYLGGTRSALTVTLSKDRNAPNAGLVHISEPLGNALLGGEEGDEVEVLVGSIIRKALIEKVTKGTNRAAEAKVREPSDQGRRKMVEARDDRAPGPAAPNRIPDKTLDPARFYESEYRSVLQALGTEYVDRLGPITFKHLSDIIARAHGFQRTGSEIKRQVWAAVSRSRRSSRSPSGDTVLWPRNMTPTDVAAFRGLTVGGSPRAWYDVPYPEKLGLALDTVRQESSRDAVAAISGKIGFTRLREATREELQALVIAARKYLAQNT